MRSKLLAASLVGLAAGPILPLPPAPPEQAAMRPVVLNVICAGQGVNFSLTPWSVGLSAANPVEWRINSTANTDEITIEPKVGEGWPFEEAPPFRATKTAPKRAGALKGGLTQGQVFHYTVTLTCQSPTGGSFRVVIDPDMVVD